MPTWLPRLSATLLAIPAALLCQELDVTVTPTPTQAVLVYYAPDESPCRVEVSEFPSFTPLAHDVDPVLFLGADQDTRPGSVVEGRARYFVAGRRIAEPASDGVRYSRALQANTLHYFRVTCGASTAAGTFQTANIPLGDTSVEQPPFDSSAPFNYAWPSLDLLDKTRTYVYQAHDGAGRVDGWDGAEPEVLDYGVRFERRLDQPEQRRRRQHENAGRLFGLG
jgi:hypothetical protein